MVWAPVKHMFHNETVLKLLKH